MDSQEQVKSLSRLREHHLRELRASGLTDETIISSGCYTEDRTPAILSILNRRSIKKACGAALVFPFRDVGNGELNGFKRIKLDCPRVRDGKPIKYESPVGATNHVYIPVGTFPHLATPATRLFVTEGEKKSLKADQEGFPCIGLTGVFSWKEKSAERLLPELETIAWDGREVVICFDSDAAEKPDVAAAESRLAAQLKLHGAKVKAVRLPAEPDGSKNGLDDFLVRHGKDEFYRLIATAEEPEPPDGGTARVLAAEIDPLSEARRILKQTQAEGHYTLRHHRAEFWRWTSGRYVKCSDDEMLSAIYKALDPVCFKINRSHAGNVLSAIKAETQLPDNREAPFWLDGKSGARNLIAFRNGLVDLDRLIAGEPAELLPHTPAWFSPVRLPYPFDPAAECPTWQAVVTHNLCADEQLISVFQEFAGYLLYPSAKFQKFMVLEGEGNNGKSVFLAVLRAMIGADNVSAVPLENFGKSFALSATLGKLANLIPECGEMDRDRIAEGHLKAFTAGDAMIFEEKFKPTFTAVPTARLVLATNNRPRFSDKSGGLWRRMILIPMQAEIAAEDRVVGMDTSDWWEQSKELPGVFLWALEGLRRLLANGRFTEAEAVTEAIADYKLELNPARTFLLDRYTAAAECHAVTADVYKAYRDWCESNGYMPLASGTFGKEIRRTFPQSRQCHITSDGRRCKAYQGIGSLPSSADF